MSSHARPPRDPAEDAPVPPSTILLLLQEASYLDPPAGDGISSSGESPDASSGPKEPGDSEFMGSFSIVRESDGSSAWEVMRLINQQCERLLQSEGPVDLDPSDAVIESKPPECPAVSAGSNACFSVYSSEPATHVEETKSGEDLAELIKTSMSDVSVKCLMENMDVESRDEGFSDRGESVVRFTGSDSPLDFTSCLVSDAESAWLPLNASSFDLNNNLRGPDKEIHGTQEVQTASWDGHRRTRRKQPRPARSPDPQDPDVQGVTFSMCPELDIDTDQSRLIITSNYSEEIRRLRRSRSSRCRSLHTGQRSSSEEESDSCQSRSKVCASCCTRKTPLWRDAEDGTPLCNACGIRYKKYRVRCQQCWNIPKKEANTSQCQKCGDVLKLKGW
ncbi:GATA-type zinc finger protein 1 isoform X2 [Pimephales promelas]|nr:GATA-type zinc finger protein 1 isoform X2 [Pimephales promelas]KAG1934209.1 GATA-type zinc finger protein [Pimephales promelas]